LVSTSEYGPFEDVGDRDPALGELYSEASDFLDRPADELRRDPGCVFFGVMAFTWDRTAVMTA
jgi:hypothetical protein